MPPNSPVELRVGSTGAGLLVGCGAGVGIITPVSLHAIPVMGQLASSLSASLGTLNSATGGVAGVARQRVQALGVRGADAGFGCGVMLGYGWGAGFMLKPTALQSLSDALRSAGQQLLARLPQPVQAAVQQRQRDLQGGAAAAAPPAADGSSLGWQHDAARQKHDASLPVPGDMQQGGVLGSSSSSDASQAAHEQWRQQEEVAELNRLVLRQQNQLGELQQQVASLQAAVCKLDASAPGCQKR